MNEWPPFLSLAFHLPASLPPGDARKVTPRKRYNLALSKAFRARLKLTQMHVYEIKLHYPQ
jgi:hypothetical protein